MSGLVKRKFFHRFIADGTYTIPNGVTMVWIECIGAGGGGGGGEDGNVDGDGGGGAGGGAMSWQVCNAVDLSSTLNVDVGTGGDGANSEADGEVGGDSSVSLIGTNNAGTDSGKLLVKAFGGGGGSAGTTAAEGGGGGGGGTGSIGINSTTNTGANGGTPWVQSSTQGDSLGGRGGKGGDGSNGTSPGFCAEYGGGGGGGGSINYRPGTAGAGGSSLFAAGAGGGGGSSHNIESVGGAGGAWGSYAVGGGGRGGAVSGTADERNGVGQPLSLLLWLLP